MPSGQYTTTQKNQITQFIAFTHTTDRVAARFLKSHNWNTEEAIDAFFHNPNGAMGGSTGGATASSSQSLNKIFDSYRGAEGLFQMLQNIGANDSAPSTEATDPADTMTVNGAMRYLSDIKVELDEITVLVIAEALKSPSMGEFTRDDFIEGWKTLGAETLEKQKTTIPRLRKSVQTEPALFKKVYRNTFLLARNPGQKAVALDTAIDYWTLFFGSGSGMAWKTTSTPWLGWFTEYLQEKWKKTVNKDMWNMTLEFAQKTLEDETMSWWEEAGAWPGVLDEFVHFVMEKRKKDGEMEVE